MSAPAASRFLEHAAAPPGEFSDRLNPVFVRELRRSLRTPFFVSGFVILQAVTFLAALIEVWVDAVIRPSSGIGSLSGLVTGTTLFAYGYVLPLAYLNSLHSELGGGRNGELLVTAGLSSWQIVGGRVLVVLSTGAVLLASVMPYLLLRYFLGRTELTDLLRSVFGLYCTHVAMSAIVLGTSVFATFVVRFLLIGSLGAVFALHQLPYRLGGSGLFLGTMPVVAAAGETLVSFLFTMIGIQIALARVRKLVAPQSIDDPGAVLVCALLVLPITHFVAFGLGGASAGVALLLLMIGVFYVLGPRQGRKNQLKGAWVRPPLPQS